MHKVEPVVFPNGERYPMLIDDAGLPHFWATLFITSQVRPSSAQARTLESYLSAIRHFMLWEEIQRRDVFKASDDIQKFNAYLLDQIRSGKFKEENF